MSATVRWVDWPTLIRTLAERGYYSRAALAKHLNVPDTSLRNWAKGHQPGHAHGEALVRTWESATGQPAPEISHRGIESSCAS